MIQHALSIVAGLLMIPLGWRCQSSFVAAIFYFAAGWLMRG